MREYASVVEAPGVWSLGPATQEASPEGISGREVVLRVPHPLGGHGIQIQTLAGRGAMGLDVSSPQTPGAHMGHLLCTHLDVQSVRKGGRQQGCEVMWGAG